jgi:hypothetical protein
LKINGKTVDYYYTATVSIGLQLGAQAKTVILLFMTKEALTNFQNSEGWEVGIDGSVALSRSVSAAPWIRPKSRHRFSGLLSAKRDSCTT